MNTINASPQYSTGSGPGPRLMTSSTLEGDEVVNLQGDKLGKIDEIMLDVPRGRIAYAVMSRGGFLGVGDRLFAVPWSALGITRAQADDVVINLTVADTSSPSSPPRLASLSSADPNQPETWLPVSVISPAVDQPD